MVVNACSTVTTMPANRPAPMPMAAKRRNSVSMPGRPEGSVAGEGEAVPAVMGGVMEDLRVGEAGTPDEEGTQEQRGGHRRRPFHHRYRPCDARSLIHDTVPSPTRRRTAPSLPFR